MTIRRGAAEVSLGVEWQPGVSALRTPRMTKAQLEQGEIFTSVEARRSQVAERQAVRVSASFSLTTPSGEQVPAHERPTSCSRTEGYS